MTIETDLPAAQKGADKGKAIIGPQKSPAWLIFKHKIALNPNKYGRKQLLKT